MALCFDYSDGRSIVEGKPLSKHLLPEWIPKKERESISFIKIRQNGRVVRCLEIDGEKIRF